MNRMNWKKILLIIIISLVVASSLFLGILQVNWSIQASRVQEQRLLESIALKSRSALYNMELELNYCIDIFKEAVLTEYYGEETLLESYKVLLKESRFPDLLENLYLTQLDGGSIDYTVFDPEKGSFVPIDPPLFLKNGEFNLNNDTLGLVMVPLPRSGNPGAVIIKMDLQYAATDVLPIFLEEELPDYQYCIERNGEILYQSNDTPNYENSDYSVSIISNILRSRHFLFISSFFTDQPPSPFFREKNFKLFGTSDSELDFNFGFPDEVIREYRDSMDIILSVNHPFGSVRTYIQKRNIRNIIISISILSILTLSMISVLFLYTRSRDFRVREQQFVASMSHELRTPITLIQSAADNLSQGIIAEKSKIARYGEIIGNHSRRLSRLVEGILLFSGLQGGGLNKLQDEECDLSSLVQEIIDSFREKAAERGIQLKSDLGNGPEAVRSDPAALRLIVENLLMNAILHGSLPGIENGPEPASEVRISLRYKAFSRAQIIVEDTGPGIKKSEQKRIFGAFQRGESPIKNHIPGSGLGLNIVKRIVELLEGELILESPYENLAGEIIQGCRFTVNLKFHQHSREKPHAEYRNLEEESNGK